jgi:hypothetical protein
MDKPENNNNGNSASTHGLLIKRPYSSWDINNIILNPPNINNLSYGVLISDTSNLPYHYTSNEIVTNTDLFNTKLPKI